ncbi:diaminopimelate aminotransferase [Pullulanibacillus camelliae]|uniref:Diaminopimelate aminotransferase n=1 Tax=Pullulanibacillus camelliae TaxID=1707096 RepID=A0A8J2VP41_9BACL|nr:pyridoxal phosphate-dependent aminotransferase [Pullulanibacillus camelliae]GGE36677.1 diaminopimelate aminotransferase [Pullulanibacillus camelliae]
MLHFEASQALQRLPKQFFAALSQKVNALVESGVDVINLGQGNPDQPTPAHIVQALQHAAENPLYHKYSPFTGHHFLKEAIATYYQREYQVTVDPTSEVAVLFGGKAGLVEISQCLLNAGDIALVPDPGYPDYWSGISMAGAEMATMPLEEAHGFLPDFSAVSSETLKQAKLMFLNYPNNPTGAIADTSFFKETVSLAEAHQIAIVHDFAYSAIGFDQHKPISFLQTPGAKGVGIEIYTMSKTYNMAGWRIGFAVGNPDLIAMIDLIQDHFYVSLFGGIQDAAAQALLGPQDSVSALAHTYESRRNALITALNEIGWSVQPPKGAFFAWLPVPAPFDSEGFAELLLNQAHVAVAPGIGFGTHGEGYVRVGLLTEEQQLLEAVKRIEALGIFQ